LRSQAVKHPDKGAGSIFKRIGKEGAENPVCTCGPVRRSSAVTEPSADPLSFSIFTSDREQASRGCLWLTGAFLPGGMAYGYCVPWLEPCA